MNIRSSKILPIALLAALSCASLGGASGCIIIADGGSNWNYDDVVKETRTASADHVAGKPLKIVTSNGAVTVRKGGTTKVEVTSNLRARTKERLEATKVVIERSADGTLTIQPVFPDNKPKGSEGCSFEITIPDAVGVSVATSNGSVDVDGMAGKAVLASSNGSITIAAHDGPAHLESSNGTIKARNVKGNIDADTSNGAIRLSGVTGTVEADTSNGTIECEMDPAAVGPANLDTSNGSITLTVGPAFGGELTADTSNASVTLVNLETDQAAVTKTHAKLKFKKSGGKSVLDTSNGSIQIKAAGAE